MQGKYLYRVCKNFYGFLLYGKVMYHPAHPAPQTIFDGGVAMNFYRWMLKKAKIQVYLEGCGACSGCIDAFEEAWAEYERERSRTEACKSS